MFAGLARRVRGRSLAGAAPHGPSCGPNAVARFELGAWPREATTGAQITSSPRSLSAVGTRRRPPRRTAHWWACPCADSARSGCGCAPRPTTRTDTAPARARHALNAARAQRCELRFAAAPRGAARHSSHRLRVFPPQASGAVVGGTGLVGLHDPLHQRMAHDVARREHGEGDAAHAAQDVDHGAKARLFGDSADRPA